MTIRKDSASGKYLYTSGRIFTKQYFRYGKFEIKAKLPVTAGVWPALWFKANSGPACVGEIDLVEYIGCMKAEKMNVNVHLWGTFGGKKIIINSILEVLQLTSQIIIFILWKC